MASAALLTSRPVSDRTAKILELGLLSNIEVPTPQALHDAMVSLEFRKREIIFGMGDSADGVYIVELGRVKIYRLSEDGREITLAILQAGDIFGEEALLNPSERATFAEALEPSTVYFVHVADFRTFATTSSHLSMRLFEIAGQRLARAHKQVEDLAFRGVTSRIADLLVSMADQTGVRDGSDIVIDPRLTHQQMASLVGTTRETFTATLSKLSGLKFIQTSRRAVRILDLAELQALI